jgi:hypothetical protein
MSLRGLSELFSPKHLATEDEVESKIIQYYLGLHDPIPDKHITIKLKLVDLFKVFLIPKLPIDDSRLEVRIKYILF